MKTLISLGDIDDVFYRLKIQGLKIFVSRIKPGSNKRIKSAWNFATKRQRTSWWEIPSVIKRWNFLISGNENTDYFHYVHEKYLSKNTVLLSPGCGSGEKEIRIAKLPKIKHIDAFDLAEKRIEKAKENATLQNVRNINFFVQDVELFESGNKQYNVILFDSFLHHVKNVGELLDKCLASLTAEGFLIINEYVGPNRFQWSKEQLKLANKLLNKIPENFRKREFDGKIKNKIYRPGILRMILSDPSEAVNSEIILNEIHKRFEIIEEKPYGGNLLQLVLKDISHNFINGNKEAEKILSLLFEAEDNFISENKSDFIFGIYTKKKL